MKFGYLLKHNDGMQRMQFRESNPRIDAAMFQKVFPGRMATAAESANCVLPDGFGCWRADDGRLMAIRD